MPDDSTDEHTRLVDQNGLTRLFANRVRARILVTLFYAEEPLPVPRIAEVAGVDQTVVHEALDPLGAFDVIETHRDSERPRYAVDEDDDLAAALLRVAELATERYHREDVEIPGPDE
ncbi:ArsR family transcriptional regulator [Halorubrum sp. SS5]|nr:ArsR family transcriptional regulator [Halorubrum sp. SS5]